jgi:hypothetical protein
LESGRRLWPVFLRIVKSRISPIGIVLAFLVGAVAVRAQAPAAPAKSNAGLTIDYVFLIDVSRSMVRPAPRNIFPRVIETITSFIKDGLDPGSTIYVIPFADNVRETREFAVRDQSDLEALDRYLHSLVADGSRTAVYDSIRAALDLVETRRLQSQRQNRAAVLHVYTDGEDNVSKGLTLPLILDRFQLRRGPYDWLFYTELGLPRDPKKQAAFNGRKNAVYVSQNAGEVHPIRQVEPLLSFVDFGRVVEGGPWPTRIMRFAIRSSREALPKLAMSIEPQFDALSAAGVLAEVQPASFPLDEKEKSLQFSWKNPLQRGKYNGKLKLTTTDPMVLIIPDELEATFTYEIPSVIRVKPLAGEQFPIALGDVPTGTTVVRRLGIAFDPEAQRVKPGLEARLEEVHGNPQPAGLGQTIYFDGAVGKKVVPVGTNIDELAIVVAPPVAMKPGSYSGTIELSSPTAQVMLDGAKPTVAQTLPIAWSFTVPPPPPPLWKKLIPWALGILLIAYLVYFNTRPPKFTDLELQILEPRMGSTTLTGQHSKTFGPSTQDLKDAAADFTVRAAKKGRRNAAMLETDGAGVRIMRRNSKIDVFGSEELFAGDVIEVAPYRLRVESFALGSEDQS